jgi:hypothetical protein
MHYLPSHRWLLRGGQKTKQTALPDKRREQHEHVLEAARAAARAGREEPAPYDHRDRPTGWSDEFDNDHERDVDDDENRNADRYGRRMTRGMHRHAPWGFYSLLKLSVTAIMNHDYDYETRDYDL